MRRSLLLALLVAGCAETAATGAVGARAVSYSKDAESNYKLGMARLEDKLYEEAIKYFTFVKDRFPYSKFAALSDLRIADSRLQARQFTDAVDQYKRFIRLHPSHEEVPYATFKIGEAYYKQLPTDFFLIPPSHEKDLTAVEEALKALEGYRKAFPTDKNVAQADKLITICKRKLADHELYVASFYQKKKKWNAVVGRLEGMNQSYRGVGLDREILTGLAEGYLQLGEREKACAAVDELRRAAPGDPEAARLSTLAGCGASEPAATSPEPEPASQPTP